METYLTKIAQKALRLADGRKRLNPLNCNAPVQAVRDVGLASANAPTGGHFVVNQAVVSVRICDEQVWVSIWILEVRIPCPSGTCFPQTSFPKTRVQCTNAASFSYMPNKTATVLSWQIFLDTGDGAGRLHKFTQIELFIGLLLIGLPCKELHLVCERVLVLKETRKFSFLALTGRGPVGCQERLITRSIDQVCQFTTND